MFAALMAIFACVMSVAALGAAWLTISGYKNGAARMDSLAAHVAKLETEVTKTSSAVLRAEVDALAGALDASRIANRREFGSIWGRLGGKREETNGSVVQTRQVGDDSFEAMLALQSLAPSKP